MFSVSINSLLDDGKISDFKCGVNKIDNFFHDCAEIAGIDGTIVTTVFVNKKSTDIIGFYSLHTSSLKVGDTETGTTTDVPTLSIAYFAIDLKYQGRGNGKLLLSHLLYRILNASLEIGFTQAVVKSFFHATEFYEKYGFRETHPVEHYREQVDMYINLEDMIKHAVYYTNIEIL